MSFTRLYPTQDASIANADPAVGSKDISFANVGASEILNLYKTSEFAATSSVLINFQPIAPISGAHVFLKLFDAQHAETLPTSYTVSIRPIEQPWSEGGGLDADFYTDTGVVNWVSASNVAAWAPPTGSASATFFFVNGHEDLEVEITSLLTSTFGFRIDIVETGTDFYTKEFHSRQTHFPTKRPYLEYRLATAVSTASLSTTMWYKVLAGDYSGTLWLSSSAWASYIASGSMATMSLYSSIVDPTGAIVVQIPNLKPVYDTLEVLSLRLQTQLKDWNPATTPSSSLVTSSVVLTKAYLRIIDVITDEVLVPFSTGALEYTRLGYDDFGNYFPLDMSGLPTGSQLQLDFLYEAPTGSGNWTLVPGNANRFRVISHG